MPAIEFSPGYTTSASSPTGLARRWISPTTDTIAGPNYSTTFTTFPIMPNYAGSTGYGMMYFHIMKGTVPTDPDTLTSFSARSADVLLTWQRGGVASATGLINGTNVSQFTTSVELANPLVLNTGYQAASAGGAATWFWWTTRASSNNPGAATDVVYHSIIGTVGATGSGADLEIANPNITAGRLYRMLNFRIQLPTTISY